MFNFIKEKTDRLFINAKTRFAHFLNEEKGDTNFISIVIIVVIVLVFAGLFLVFGKQVFAWLNEKWEEFKANF